MELSNDHLRRELRETVREQSSTMRSMRDLVARLFDPATKVRSTTKGDLVLGGFNRRGFLRIGGMTVVSAALLAACGDDDDDGDQTATTAAGLSKDVVILRTASSLERYAVDLYGRAAPLLKTPALLAAATLFRDQHTEHALLFEGATDAKAPGKAFKDPNPAVASMLKPRVDALKTEMDVLALAYDVESVAAATYFSTVAEFEDRSLNKAAMSVGGVEARHVAILGGVLKINDKPSFPASGFQTSTGAVAAGTGVS